MNIKYIVTLLNLKKDKEHKDRYITAWGSKTYLGIYLVLERVININNIDNLPEI